MDRPSRAARPAARLWVILSVALTLSTTVQAEDEGRPLSVEAVLGLEAFGRASIAPAGDRAVYEKRGAYDIATRFDLGQRSSWTIMQVWALDLRRADAHPVRLLPQERSVLLCGSWSPSGQRLAVCRLNGDHLELGVLDMETGTADWTGLTPELPQTGGTMAWIDDRRLAVLTRPDGSLPWLLRYSSGSQAKAAVDWRRTAEGREASRTLIDADDGILSSQALPADQALLILDTVSGARRDLAMGQISDFNLSPDGTVVAVVERGGGVPVQRDEIAASGTKARERLRLIGLDGRADVRLAPDLDIGPGLLAWSPRSDALLVWGRTDGQSWAEGDLVTVATDGVVTALRREGLEPIDPKRGLGFLAGVRADWLGDAPVLYARGPGTRFDWHLLDPVREPVALTGRMVAPPARINAVSRDGLFFVADGAVWLATASGTRRLTRQDETYTEATGTIGDTDKPFRLRLNSAPRRERAVATAADGSVVSVGMEGEALRLGDGRSAGRLMAVGETAALGLEAARLVETLRVSGRGSDRSIDQANGAAKDLALIRPVDVPHLDRLGRPTVSRLFLPLGVPPSEIKGVIVYAYPGSVETGAWYGPFALVYGLNADLLASTGYAVLSPSIPDDPDKVVRPEDLVQSLDLAVDAMLAAHPDLPAGRMAVVGHSFGGGMALTVATRSTRYRSYVEWAGHSDLFSKWGEFTPVTRQMPEEGFMIDRNQAWVETGQANRGGPPWAGVDRYVDFSPLLSADRVTAPVLFIAGDRDFVPVSQAEQMFSALYRLGGKARLITYWGEDHFNWSPANIRDLYTQIFEWLDLTLLAPPQADSPRP